MTIRFIPKLFFIVLTTFLSLQAYGQAITREALRQAGPYQVASYTEFPSVAEFGAGTIYYPSDKTEPFGGVSVSPGFMERQENMSWWGPHLASHGFAVLTLDTNELGDTPDLRAEALIAAINVLRDESGRSGSPLYTKIDPTRMAVMGHSMGGGGTLLAANDHSDQIKAAIPFTPWQPDGDFGEVSVPTLVIAGEIDRIAPSAVHAWPHFQTLATQVPKMYLEIKGGNHFIANTDTPGDRLQPNMDVLDLVGYMGAAWLKLYVDGDERYRDLLFGDLPASDSERLSRFEFNE